jgi:hypothetical protein
VSEDVTIVTAGLGDSDGTATFAADGSAGGRVEAEAATKKVRVERLSKYLTEPVDFLKLNIEGQELPVLRECAEAGVLKNVRQMVVEYHGWARGKQCLGDLLSLLDSQGFRYLLHDFDAETCVTTKPPFRHRPNAHWFCLIYARQDGI